jgi:hypothetical protein
MPGLHKMLHPKYRVMVISNMQSEWYNDEDYSSLALALNVVYQLRNDKTFAHMGNHDIVVVKITEDFRISVKV